MDFIGLGVILVEVIVLLLIGFIVGRFVYYAFSFLLKTITARTKTKLDDYIFEGAQGPLELISTVLIFYFLSLFFANLSEINLLLANYALSITILIIAYTLGEILGAVLRWYYYEGQHKSKIKFDVTLLPFLRKFTKTILMLIGIGLSLSIIGIDVTGIFAITSVLVLILGLASQETLGNLFSGLALQLDRPFKYGDILVFTNGDIAKLKKIGTRSTKLIDQTGNYVVLSNSEFARQRLTILTPNNNKITTTIPLEVPISRDYSQIEKIIKKSIPSEINKEKTEYSISIDKINKDTYQLGIQIKTNDITHFAILKNRILQKLLPEIQRISK